MAGRKRWTSTDSRALGLGRGMRQRGREAEREGEGEVLGRIFGVGVVQRGRWAKLGLASEKDCWAEWKSGCPPVGSLFDVLTYYYTYAHSLLYHPPFVPVYSSMVNRRHPLLCLLYLP